MAAELLAQENAFVLEAKRRIAERVLATAIVKELPVRTCQRYLAEVARLGFTDLIQECTVRIIFCRYLIKRDSAGGAAEMLRPLLKKCMKTRGKDRQELVAFKNTIERLLRECEP
jgi:hypothetical protein